MARLAGVSRTAVTKACGAKLRNALVGKRIDLNHPTARIYLAGRDEPTTDAEDTDENDTAEPTTHRPDRIDLDGDVEQCLDLTLREITDQFRGFQDFEDWLNQRKKIADIHEKDLKNDEMEGVLIPREGVRVHVFGAFDAAFERLVRDVPRNTSARTLAAARSGANTEEIERLIRDAISAVLKPLKQKLVRALRES